MRDLVQNMLDVLSLKKYIELYNENSVIVITCQFYEEIIDQLEPAGELDGMECYLDLFLNEYVEHFDNYPVPKNKENRIPKKLHYCWFGGNDLPDEYLKYIESWMKYCPDYEIIKWDESNYDITKNQFMRQAYENKKWAFVTDYVRVDVIYQYGEFIWIQMWN